MRTRRHFQPTVDGLPSRIAPSAIGGLLQSSVLGPVSSLPGSNPPAAAPMDSDTPPGNGSPIVLAPPPSTPPTTQPC